MNVVRLKSFVQVWFRCVRLTSDFGGEASPRLRANPDRNQPAFFDRTTDCLDRCVSMRHSAKADQRIAQHSQIENIRSCPTNVSHLLKNYR